MRISSVEAPQIDRFAEFRAEDGMFNSVNESKVL